MFLRHSIRPTAGVTIVECLVALVLLAVGVLGAAGTIGAAARVMRVGDSAAASARRLLSLADSIGAAGDCAAVTGGATREGAIHYAWTVTAAVGGVDVKLTATYPAAAGYHVDSVLTRVGCLP